MSKLQEKGYKIKRGKNISVRGENQKRFIRFGSLPDGFREDDFRAIIAGSKLHPRKSPQKSNQSINQIIEMQEEVLQKGPAYQMWAAKFNTKQIAETLLFMSEHKLNRLEDLQQYASSLVAKRNDVLESVRSAEERLGEIAALKKHIVNYSKTLTTYEAYCKSGYSKKFLAAHLEEIKMHKEAKQAFDKFHGPKLPTIKELNIEYSAVLTKKKEDYVRYRQLSADARDAQVVLGNYAAMTGMKYAPADRRTSNHQKHSER